MFIDTALNNSGMLIDYGFNKVEGHEKIPLYKMHGSLNWNYCPICKNINYINSRCENCSVEMSPIIVPPSFFKNYQNIYLSIIWNKVERAFAMADNIIFCGYSFCDADIYIKYLLKKGEFQKGITKYYIINNFNGKTSRETDEEKNKYYRFFKNKKHIIYTELSFEQFALNPSLII